MLASACGLWLVQAQTLATTINIVLL